MRFLPLLTLIACANAAELPVHRDEVVPVSVMALSREPVSRPIHGVGTVRASEEVALAFPLGGVVVDVPVVPGQAVRRGAVIARIDASAVTAQLAVAESALAKAERDAARATALEGTALSPAQREDALTGLEIARANVAAARFPSQRATVVAPADGVIVALRVEEGQTVAPGVPVAFFSGGEGFEVALSLPAADALASPPGTPATVAIAALGATLEGRVTERSGGAGPLGLWSLTVALDPTDRPLASGLVATVDLRPAPESLATVPIEALAEADGADAALFTVDASDVARRVPVRIAFLTNDRAALDQAPADGTPVVVAGVPFLTDGATVSRSDR